MGERAYDAVFFDLFGTLVDDRGDALQGAVEVTSALGSARWAVVTSCPRMLADALLLRAKLPAPPFLVSADDVSRGKPAPDCYELAANRAGVTPERCLVIEDSGHGTLAGLAAGMDVIAVKRGRSIVFPQGACVVESLRELRLVPAANGAVVLR